jgi:ABC-type multidrug transport system fused ATPase/permease subunit
MEENKNSTTLNKYLTDLVILLQGVSDKLKDKLNSPIDSSITHENTELDEKVERLKRQPIIERLNYLYGDKTFSGRYGIDIIKVCLVIFIIISAITYFHIQNKLLEVKRDWPEYRCRPDVMPFAGWINAPEGVSPMEYTKQNFMECSANTTKGVFDQPMTMVYVIFNVVMGIFKNILEAIEKFRLIFDRIRNALKTIFLSVLNRIQNVVIPLQNMLIKMVDFFEKIKGILATYLLTFIGALWSFYSLIGSIYELVIIILIIMIIVIIVLWYIPFVGWVLAIAAIAVFLTIAIPLILLGIVSRQITRQRTSRMPSPDD